MDLPQRKASVFKVVRIARCGRVPHVGKLPFVARRTHSKQFRGYSRVEDEVAVEQLDLFNRLVPSWNALRYSAITNVDLGLGVVGVWDVLVTARYGGARVGTFSLEKRHVACVHFVFLTNI
jgi:hypothetical protein